MCNAIVRWCWMLFFSCSYLSSRCDPEWYELQLVVKDYCFGRSDRLVASSLLTLSQALDFGGSTPVRLPLTRRQCQSEAGWTVLRILSQRLNTDEVAREFVRVKTECCSASLARTNSNSPQMGSTSNTADTASITGWFMILKRGRAACYLSFADPLLSNFLLSLISSLCQCIMHSTDLMYDIYIYIPYLICIESLLLYYTIDISGGTVLHYKFVFCCVSG